LFVKGADAFLAEPLVSVSGVVPFSLIVLLDEPGVVHGAKLADKDGFGFLIEFGGECHGSETMSMGLRTDAFSWLGCCLDFLRSPPSVVTRYAAAHEDLWILV